MTTKSSAGRHAGKVLYSTTRLKGLELNTAGAMQAYLATFPSSGPSLQIQLEQHVC